MEQVDSLIQQAQHLACTRRSPLDFTGASKAEIIEMIKEEIIELMKGNIFRPAVRSVKGYRFFNRWRTNGASFTTNSRADSRTRS